MPYLYADLTYDLIGACMEVHGLLGHGHKETIYADALSHELKLRQMDFIREKQFKVSYKDIILPHDYYADFVVNDIIILEIKAIKELNSSHLRQTLNYLAASQLRLGLLVNFGSPSLEFKRVIFKP